MATTLPMPYESVLIVFDDGKEKRQAVKYNAVAVKLPAYDHALFLVVVKGFGIKPMMLLTGKKLYQHTQHRGAGTGSVVFAAVYPGQNIKLKVLVERVFLLSKRFFGVPSFFNYAIADGIFNLLCPDKTALRGLSPAGMNDFQLHLEFGQHSGNSKNIDKVAYPYTF